MSAAVAPGTSALPAPENTPALSTRKLLTLVGLGVIVGGAAEYVLLTSDIPDGGVGFAVLALVIAWSFIGTGLFAWWRRPESRTGFLMVAVGFSWCLGALVDIESPIPFAVGMILSNLWVILLIRLLITFPTGRLRDKPERVVMAGAWISGLALQVPPLLFLATPDSDRCPRCPSNPLLITDDPGLTDLLFGVQALVAVPTLVGLLVMLVRRWRAASPAQRGAFTPVLWVGGATLALLALQLIALVANLPTDVTDGLFLLQLVPFTAVPFAFMIGLLGSRFSRESAVSELIEQLGSIGGEADLRSRLAVALGDPGLALAYWIPSAGRFVDAEGAGVELPASGDHRRAASLVERDGAPVAALIHDPALLDHPELVRTVGAAAALALENERLDAELRARVEELRASRARIVEAADAGRRQIERDLHDGAQQRLVSLALALRLTRDRLATDPEGAATMLDEAMEELDTTTLELRELARGIHPAVLTDRGLGAAVDALGGRAPLPVDVIGYPDRRLPSATEAAAYFVVAEALTNVSRYAEASAATVRIVEADGELEVEVADDGVGGADPAAGSGLSGLADRLAALDGSLEVISPPGSGTRVKARIPCAR